MIFGSAVSPAVDSHMDFELKILRHVVGQSMISALSRPAVVPEGPAVEPRSAALTEDIQSTFLKRIRRHASNIDALVVTLADERHGVIHLPDGSYVTHTPELAASGLLEAVDGKKTIVQPVTARHWTLWEAAANRLFRALSEAGLRDRTIVLDMPGAEGMEPEVGAVAGRHFTSTELNAYLTECAAHIRSLGFKVATLPNELRPAPPRGDVSSISVQAAEERNSWIAARIASVALGRSRNDTLV